MKNVKDFKYLGSTVSKDGSLEGELEERVSRSRKVAGALKAVVKNKSVR